MAAVLRTTMFQGLPLFFMWLYLTRSSAHTFRGKVLFNHVYKSTPSASWMVCVQMCSSDESCFSYNYKADGEAQGLCELNNCGFPDECSGTDELLFAVEYVFHQLRQATVVLA